MPIGQLNLRFTYLAKAALEANDFEVGNYQSGTG
jgi:hypothetical protein